MSKNIKLFIENCDNIIALCSETKELARERDWENAMESLNNVADEWNEAVEIAERGLARLRVKVATGL